MPYYLSFDKFTHLFFLLRVTGGSQCSKELKFVLLDILGKLYIAVDSVYWIGASKFKLNVRGDIILTYCNQMWATDDS